jgi:hypothetical protein
MALSTTERVAIVGLPVETRLFMATLAVLAEKYVNSPVLNEHVIQEHNEEVVRNALCAGQTTRYATLSDSELVGYNSKEHNIATFVTPML